MAKLPKDIIREEILSLRAYHVLDARGMVKLDAMENPYRMPPELLATLSEQSKEVEFNRYPDPAARELKSQLRNAMQIPADSEVVVGNGSDELIQMLALATARPRAVMLGLEPSFAMFRMIASFAGMRYVGVPLEADFTIAEAQTLEAIEQHQPALIFIAYPNNPTGNLFDAQAIERIIAAAPGIVVVDEAYHAFAGRTFMSRLGAFDNLMVMRTLSKLGLAGLRLGLLAGHPQWLHEIDKVRLPYNVNVLTQTIATQALRQTTVFEEQAAAIRAERQRVLSELKKHSAIEAYASDANFILFRVTQADQIFNALKERRILIKNLHGSHPLLANCLRVTIGAPAENTQFLNALGEIIAA